MSGTHAKKNRHDTRFFLIGAVITLSVHPPAFGKSESDNHLSRQTPKWILAFKTPSAAMTCRPPSEFAVIKVITRYSIVRAKEKPNVAKIKALCPKLISVSENTVYKLTSETLPIPRSRPPSADDESGRCNLIPSNRPSRAANEWNRQMTNTDLMVEDFKKLGVDPKSVQFAVIDAGFNPAHKDYVDGTVEVVQQIADDPTGHGTFDINQLLHEAPGARIKSHGVFDGKGNSTAAQVYYDGILNACKSGVKVINGSFASDSHKPVLVEFPELKADLRENGCVFIQAAGNRNENVSYFTDRWPPSFDVITVSGLNADGDLLKISSSGLVAAPGADIMGPLSPADGTYQLKTGTSQATIPTTAIAGYVLEALSKKSPAFNSLPNSNKSAAVTNIVRLSSGRPSVDGVRAFALVKAAIESDEVLRVLSSPRRTAMTIQKKLAAKIFSDAKGQVPTAPCKHIADCAEKRKCYNEKRRYVSLAEKKEPPDEVFKDLKETAALSLDPSLIRQWALKNYAEAK